MAMHVANETYLTLHDPRHNLLSIADSTGTVAAGNSLRYEPFGTPSVGATPSGIEPRFGGMRYLPGTQLYLSDTRLMDPRHGAWLSPDPLGYVDSPNLYAYARQNPIDFVDPSGLGTEKGKNSDGGDIFDWFADAKETLSEGVEGLLEAAEDSFNFYKGLVTSEEFTGFWRGFGKRSLEIAGAGMYGMGVRTPWTTQMYVREGQQSWEGMKAGAHLFTAAWDASWGDASAELRRQEMVSGIVNNFATMSPEEWGSMGPDVFLGVGTGGAGGGRAVISTVGRAARMLPRTVTAGGKRAWRWGRGNVPTAEAAEAYDVIRQSTTDIKAIARNTGYKPENIARIKNYLFNNAEWTGPDADIANAWHRMRTGKVGPNERLLLKHETAEMWYRENVLNDYSRAHRVANRKFNWQQTLE